MTQAMHRLLLVEDDPGVRKVLVRLFEVNGFRVLRADTCELAIRQGQSQRPDLCILDLGLPDCDGVNFIRRTRAWSSVPIMVLTARVNDADRIAAFEAGADDYVLKPFCVLEVLARVRAILRRTVRTEEPLIKLGAVVIDLGKRVTHGSGGEVRRLTPLEHRILECLIRHGDRIVRHSQLMKEVWGPHQTDIRGLRFYIASLRRKLETDPAHPRYILTEPGVGYRLAMCPQNFTMTPAPQTTSRLRRSGNQTPPSLAQASGVVPIG